MDILRFINEQMDILKVPYEYGEWTTEVSYPYFVGELIEDPYATEDGAKQYAMKITGWNRGYMVDLERHKNEIERHFHPITGLCSKTERGSVSVWYENAFYIPTGEAELKRIEISLTVKEWRGDL